MTGKADKNKYTKCILRIRVIRVTSLKIQTWKQPQFYCNSEENILIVIDIDTALLLEPTEHKRYVLKRYRSHRLHYNRLHSIDHYCLSIHTEPFQFPIRTS